MEPRTGLANSASPAFVEWVTNVWSLFGWKLFLVSRCLVRACWFFQLPLNSYSDPASSYLNICSTKAGPHPMENRPKNCQFEVSVGNLTSDELLVKSCKASKLALYHYNQPLKAWSNGSPLSGGIVLDIFCLEHLKIKLKDRQTLGKRRKFVGIW